MEGLVVEGRPFAIDLDFRMSRDSTALGPFNFPRTRLVARNNFRLARHSGAIADLLGKLGILQRPRFLFQSTGEIQIRENAVVGIDVGLTVRGNVNGQDAP